MSTITLQPPLEKRLVNSAGLKRHLATGARYPLKDRDWYLWRLPEGANPWDYSQIGPIAPGITVMVDPWKRVLCIQVMRGAL